MHSKRIQKKSLFKEKYEPKDLIPLCKAGRVEYVKSHVRKNPDDIYVLVPTEFYTYDKKSGLRCETMNMNLITYSLLFADYDTFAGILVTLDDRNRKIMDKFFDETLRACQTLPVKYSFVQVLQEYASAMQSFDSIKDTRTIGQIMLCLPSYMLQSMCHLIWGLDIHYENIRSNRRNKPVDKLEVFLDKNQTVVEFNAAIKFKRSAYPMFYRGENNYCRKVSIKRSNLDVVKQEAMKDFDYINAALAARMLEIHIKIMEMAVYLKNNLNRANAWNEFQSVWIEHRNQFEFVKAMTDQFILHSEHSLLHPLINKIRIINERKAEPMEYGDGTIPLTPSQEDLIEEELRIIEAGMIAEEDARLEESFQQPNSNDIYNAPVRWDAYQQGGNVDPNIQASAPSLEALGLAPENPAQALPRRPLPPVPPPRNDNHAVLFRPQEQANRRVVSLSPIVFDPSKLMPK